MTTEASKFPNILELIYCQAERDGRRVALLDMEGEELTYGELRSIVELLATQMQGLNSVPDSSRPRIAIVLPNGIQMSVVLLAAAIAGEAVPLNPSLTRPEYHRIIDLTQIGVLVALPDDEGAAVAAAKQLDIPIVRLVHGYKLDQPISRRLKAPEAAEVAVVLTTSGSTGLPKIVPLTHRNLCRSMHDVAKSLALSPDDCCLTMWEQYHIGGIVDLLLAPLCSGGSIVLAGGFDASRFLPTVEKFRPSWFQGVPTSLSELVGLIERSGISADTLRSMRFIRSVAAPLTTAQLSQLEKCFGVPIVRTFGMTEASPLITSTALPPGRSKPGSVGKSAGPEVGVFGHDGEPLPRNVVGEIAVRGENVFSGYEGDPELNKLVFRQDWFITGDLGFLDEDDELFITGRAKEQINRGGFKVSPLEVEEVLFSHSSVNQAAVFSVRHPTLAEDVVAAIVTREGVTVAELQTFLRGRLARYKVPGQILLLAELPRNAVGKVDKIALAKLVGERLQDDFTPPRNAIERFLTTLWCSELHLQSIGVHANFFAAGGDSLSALRIQHSIETSIGRSLPDHVFESSNTVAELASYLSSQGLLSDWRRNEEAGRPLHRGVMHSPIGSEDISEDFKETPQAISKAFSPRKIRMELERLTTYATSRQIVDMLPLLAQTEPGAKCHDGQLETSRRNLRSIYDLDLAKIHQELLASPHGLAWKRNTITPCAFLYDREGAAYSERTLIVAFTGNWQRLQMPTYRFLNAIHPCGVDLLLLRDPSLSLFFRSFEGVGDSLSSMSAFLDAFVRRKGYGKVMAIGTSGGSFAALTTALTNRWSLAVAVNAPLLSVHQEFAEPLQQLSKKHELGSTRIIIANSCSARDEIPALQLLDAIPNAEHQEFREYTNHNLLNSAYVKGTLPRILKKWFFDSERDMREEHDHG